MQKILVSACLLGDKVRYNAEGKRIDSEIIQQWQQEGRLIAVCPEVSGGLPVPRPPAEQQTGGRVMDNLGADVTNAFQQGARYALTLAEKYQIRYALLKARSPSCGNEQIYDGSFSGILTEGQGVTAALLSEHGIRVFNETQIPELAAIINSTGFR